MTDLLTPARSVAAIKFKWQKDDKTYDYFVPVGMELNPGDKVVVATARGESIVEVVAIKAESEMAQKEILRIAPVDPAPAPAETKPAEDWNF